MLVKISQISSFIQKQLYVILNYIIGVFIHISLRLQIWFKSPEFFSFLKSSHIVKNPCTLLPLKKS